MANIQLTNIIDLCNKHCLVGIGDFSHGIKNIWKLRIKVIKELLKTNKKITIFQEDMVESIENIYNDKKLEIYKKEYYRQKYPLMKYGFRIYSCQEYIDLIKLLRKNKDKIKMYGIDTASNKRDKDMYKNIMKNIDYNGYNLFFAHNFHIDSRSPTWMKTKTTGYYLSQKLKDKYKIILSCGITGSIRYEAIDGNIQEKTFSKKINIKKLYKLKNKNYISNYSGNIFEIGWSWSKDIKDDYSKDLFNVKNVDLIVFDKVNSL